MESVQQNYIGGTWVPAGATAIEALDADPGPRGAPVALVAAGRAEVPWVVEPGTAADDTAITIARCSRAPISGVTLVAVIPAVFRPLPDMILVNQAISSLWLDGEEEERGRQRSATVVALTAIGPKDELEGMIAAQLLGAHNATMECYRRAMIPEQTLECHRECLDQANKLSGGNR